jgi:Protein of unknown function (DUF1566)/PEGA domain
MARTRIDMGIGWCEKEKMQGRRGVSMRTPLTTAIAFLVAFVIGVTPAAAGTLKVTSFPSGAQVIVDGVNTGKVTPMNISVADGDHIVTVQIPGSGWNPDTRTVTIGPGNNDLSVTLLPMLAVGPPGPKGDTGDKGDKGDSGTNGTDGQDGANATRADGSCFDNTNRYVDCGNGTVTDTVTGLIWLKQSNCLPNNNWTGANQAAAGLKDGDCGLTDGSSAGDWRLPTKDEWSAMVARAIAMGCGSEPVPVGFAPLPAFSNDAVSGCYLDGSPTSFSGVFASVYWSSTAIDINPTFAWTQSLSFFTQVTFQSKSLTHEVWPVRGGPR